jgi:competence protein CoiA
MKFAVVDGHRQEAQPGLLGKCQCCGSPMIAKCGEVRMWHWARLTKRGCDVWWENEGEWHRAWKNKFPDSWQEIGHPAENGMKHIADVKTDHGWIVEFQHSHIAPEERRSRDVFYKKLVWVVDGTRLKRAKSQFMKTWGGGMPLGSGNALRKVFLDECALLREWAGSQSPIFFDFGEEHLWWLIANSGDGRLYVGQFPRAEFIETLRGGTEQAPRDFSALVKHVVGQLAAYEAANHALAQQRARVQSLQANQQYLAWQRRFRSRS